VLALAAVGLSGCATAEPGTRATTAPTTTSTGVVTTATTVDTTPGSAPSAASCGVVAASGVAVAPGSTPCLVTVRVGTGVGIDLGPGFAWSDPTSSSAAVRVTDVGRPPAGGLTAVLEADAPGTATVTSSGPVVCTGGGACPALARLWRLEVDVTGG
jgi:hypothetical protein